MQNRRHRFTHRYARSKGQTMSLDPLRALTSQAPHAERISCEGTVEYEHDQSARGYLDLARPSEHARFEEVKANNSSPLLKTPPASSLQVWLRKPQLQNPRHWGLGQRTSHVNSTRHRNPAGKRAHNTTPWYSSTDSERTIEAPLRAATTAGERKDCMRNTTPQHSSTSSKQTHKVPLRAATTIREHRCKPELDPLPQGTPTKHEHKSVSSMRGDPTAPEPDSVVRAPDWLSRQGTVKCPQLLRAATIIREHELKLVLPPRVTQTEHAHERASPAQGDPAAQQPGSLARAPDWLLRDGTIECHEHASPA
jgi:hypothetical protein